MGLKRKVSEKLLLQLLWPRRARVGKRKRKVTMTVVRTFRLPFPQMLPLLGASNKVRWQAIIKWPLRLVCKFAMSFYRMITADDSEWHLKRKIFINDTLCHYTENLQSYKVEGFPRKSVLSIKKFQEWPRQNQCDILYFLIDYCSLLLTFWRLDQPLCDNLHCLIHWLPTGWRIIWYCTLLVIHLVSLNKSFTWFFV